MGIKAKRRVVDCKYLPIQSVFMTLFLIIIVTFSSSLLAHELKVTVRAIGPVTPGGQPPVVEIDVHHYHQCEVKLVPNPPSIEGVEVIMFRHHKKMTAAELAKVRARGAAWVAANGGGNVVQASPPTSAKNCFGVTFDNGNSWIDDPSAFISKCTPWSPPPATPPAGTVVIYQKDGRVVHSGKVIPTPPGKNGVWVHGQWGNWGNFDHKVDVVPEEYGTASYMMCP